MIESRRISRNVFANVAQVLIGTVLLFLLYRYINVTLGVAQLGVWSVVLTTVSASRLADLGLSAGVTRFVARDLARSNPERASDVLDTASLTLLVVIGGVLLPVYFLIKVLLPHFFEDFYLAQALEILPYALLSFWLVTVASVSQGGLDGCQRMDIRASLVVSGQSLSLLLSILLVPKHGLLGLAWAQIGQGIFLFIGGRLLLWHTLTSFTLLPSRWSRRVIGEMLSYGANVQVASVFMLMFDAFTKVLMARFGGPVAAGYFEMASQVVAKARALIVTGNQAVVPHVAAIVETKPSDLESLYTRNIGLLTFITLPIFSLLFAWAGGISWLLSGAYQPEFVFMVGLLALAWMGNIFSAPAYFINMGTGKIGWNTLSHVLIGVVNVGLGWVLGVQFGAQGVVFAYLIALLTGSIVLFSVFHYKNRISFRVNLLGEHLWHLVAAVVVVIFGLVAPLQLTTGEMYEQVILLAACPVLLGLGMWFHPMRHQLMLWKWKG